MSVTDTSGARSVEGPTGRLEVVVHTPRPAADSGERPTPRAAVVLAHPHPQHGGTMHSNVVHHMANALSRIGYIVVRFNFRGVGASTGTFDGGVGESDDFGAMLDYAAEQYPGLGLYAAGYSFGGRIALTTGATDPRVQLLLAVAPPVDRDMTPVLATRKPTFLIHGERDGLVPLKAMWRFYATLQEPKELVVVDAADHTFDGKTSEVGDAVVDLLEDFEL